GLDARMQPSQHRVLPILIHVQAFAWSLHQFQALRFAVAINVESQTWLHAREGADWAFYDVVLLCDRPRDFFFVVLAGWQVSNRPSGFLYAAQCGCFDAITNLVGMRAEIFEQNMIGPKVA